jgi:glycosyltransferase involved in cell wall biosynthesis
VRTNSCYRPAWVANVRGLRAVFRLLPYIARLWKCAGRVDLFHVMANSGWAWHLFAAPAIWVAKLRHIPVVVNYRGGAAEAFLRGSAPAVRPTMRLAEKLVVPSGFLVDVFHRYGMKAEIVPNVVDLRRFVSRGAVDTSSDAWPHVVVTRNLEAIYGVDVALQAFRDVLERYPGARLTVAGSGPEHGKLVAMAHGLGIAARVQFAGRLDNDEVARLYRRADILLNPSRVDNTPISILEALASEVPVVSTDAGGIPYLVRHGETALLVAVDDAKAMADAVCQLLESPDLTRRMTSAGRALAQQHAWSSVRPKLLELYRQLIAGAAATRAVHAK